MKWIWVICLTCAAWEDWKSRKISMVLLCIAALPGIWNMCVSDIWMHLRAAWIGIVMLAVSKATRGALGEGDGWFFLLSACYLEQKELVLLLLGSLGIGCVWGMALLMYGRWSGKYEAARETIPFLTCAWPVGIWLAVMERSL